MHLTFEELSSSSEAAYRFAAIINSSNDAIISKDLNGVISSWNMAAEKIFGFTSEEAIGKSIEIILPAEKISEEKEILNKIISGQEIRHYETIRKTKTGETVQVSLSFSPIYNHEKKIIGLAQIARDISFQIQSKEKNAMLAAIINSSSDAIASKDLNGYITSWNKAAENIFGYKPEEIIGKHVTILIPEDRLFEEDMILSEVRAGRSINGLETIRKRKDGQLINVHLTISPIWNENKKIIGISKIAKNISDYHQAKEKNAMLAAIVDSSDDAIISKNLNGVITSWNKGAVNIFGYLPEEAIGKHITLIIPEDRKSEEDVIISKIKKGERIEHFETKRLTKSGDLIDLSITVSPIKNEKNEIIGASKIARDITEKVKAKMDLEKANSELVKLNDYKDEFISLASHELNTPLTSLKVYLQILESNIKSNNTEGNENFIVRALNLSSKLGRLIKDLLDVSKIESGKLIFDKTVFNVMKVVDETIDAMSAANKKFNIIHNKATEQALIFGDPDRIEQVFMNLLSNAFKYSPNADKVLIKTYTDNGFFYLSIKDYGIGIPSNQMHKLFSRFFRAEGLKASFSGLGIGLYLSNQIVARHDGKIAVESKEGEGSTFTVIIPLAKNND